MTYSSEPASPRNLVSILRELDLGHHTLILRDDGSLELQPHETQPPDKVTPVVVLQNEETYRLLVSLQAEFSRTFPAREVQP